MQRADTLCSKTVLPLFFAALTHKGSTQTKIDSIKTLQQSLSSYFYTFSADCSALTQIKKPEQDSLNLEESVLVRIFKFIVPYTAPRSYRQCVQYHQSGRAAQNHQALENQMSQHTV